MKTQSAKNLEKKNSDKQFKAKPFEMNRLRPSLIHNKTNKTPTITKICPDTSLEEMKKCIPEWLIARKDFKSLYTKMKLKVGLDIGEICMQPLQNRSEDEKEAIFLWVYSKNFFSKMPRILVREACDRLSTVTYLDGKVLMKKGDEGDCMFIIYKGQVGIYVNGLRVAHRVSGEVVGETALDTDKPRSADVIAEQVVVVLKLKKIDYSSILLTLKKLEKFESSKFLMKIEMFSKWSLPRMQVLCDYLIVSKYGPGEMIYEADSKSTGIYIILSGSVVFQKFCGIVKRNKWPVGLKSWEVQKVTNHFLIDVGRMEQGGIFGNEAISNIPYLTRATSLGECTCLVLNTFECLQLFTKNDLNRIQAYSLPIPPSPHLKSLTAALTFNKSERVPPT